MINDFTSQVQTQQAERELTQRLERRRIAAERAVQEHGGERLALIAHLARQTRATRQVSARPTVAGC